jgi:hypothetical protein
MPGLRRRGNGGGNRTARSGQALPEPAALPAWYCGRIGHILLAERTRHADAEIVLLDLDLGKIFLVEQLGYGADQVLIDIARLGHACCLPRLRVAIVHLSFSGQRFERQIR